MSTTLATTNANAPVVTTGASLPSVFWRAPQTVPPEDISASIKTLEQACLAEPRSANLRTCLGMACAMNFDVSKSMDALEVAVTIDPGNFWAQLKYAELHYRLRVLNKAEKETRKALDLATNSWQLSIARKQLQAIRTLKLSSVRNVEWTKPLAAPALVLSAMLLAIVAFMMWT